MPRLNLSSTYPTDHNSTDQSQISPQQRGKVCVHANGVQVGSHAGTMIRTESQTKGVETVYRLCLMLNRLNDEAMM